MITQEELKNRLIYNPSTGEFTERCSGRVAGSTTHYGYVQIGIDYEDYKAHRLAFLYMTGSIPKMIDHRNRVRNDNRWCNLRESDHEKNNCNTSVRSDNTSGVKGVTWDKNRNKWQAKVQFKGKTYGAGYHINLKDAEIAVSKKRYELHGDFANQS